MPQTIGYLIPEFPGQTHAFFMRERQELRKRGIDTVLLSTRPPSSSAAAQHDWADSAREATTYLTPFRLRYLPVALRQLIQSGPQRWWRCWRAIQQTDEISFGQRLKLLALIPVAAWMISTLRRKKCSHLHIHSCANSAWVGVFTHLLSDINYSLTLHGPLKDYGPAQAIKWSGAAFVIVITQHLLQEAREEISPELLPLLYLAPMGVDINRFRRSRPYVPSTPHSPIRLVSCGRINPCKGHDDLIRAVAELREHGLNVQLTICGAIDSQRQDYVDLLNRLIEEHGLQSSVSLLGSVSEDRVRAELELAHFFCLASHQEPLGVATMEAMSMEMPVIVTKSPGVTEMITHEHDGILVHPHQPQDFVAAIQALVDAPQQCQNLARQARLTVEQSFHSGVSAEIMRQALLDGGQDLKHRDNLPFAECPLTAEGHRQNNAATSVLS